MLIYLGYLEVETKACWAKEKRTQETLNQGREIISPVPPGGNVFAISLTCLLDNCTCLSHDAAGLFQVAVKSCGNEGYHEKGPTRSCRAKSWTICYKGLSFVCDSDT